MIALLADLLMFGLLLSLTAGEAVGATCGFTDIATGESSVIAIKATDHTLQCWGSDFADLCADLPAGTFSRVAADQDAACGVKLDGSLACWGINVDGIISEVPAGTDYVDVKLGHVEACALKNDGTVVCWGDTVGGASNPFVAPTGTFESISGHQDLYCGVHVDGSLQCFGFEITKKECDGGPRDGALCSDGSSCSACIPTGGGEDHAIGCTSNADCFGTCEGIGTTCSLHDQEILADLPAGTGYAKVSAQFHSACYVKDDGTLGCWGEDNDGGMIGSEPAGSSFVEPMSDYSVACVTNTDGEVECWGNDDDGVIATAPATGGFHNLDGYIWNACALDGSGNAYCWGGDYFGETTEAPAADCTTTTTTTLPETTTTTMPPPSSAPLVAFVAG